MDSTNIYTAIIVFFSGVLTVFLIFHKKLLHNFTFFTHFNKKKSIDPSDMTEEELYKLLTASLDFSLYEDPKLAVEIERQRIASDIHDEMAALTSLYIDLENLSNEKNATSAITAQSILDMRLKISNTVDSLRRTISGMLPVGLENLDLDTSIQQLCNSRDRVKGTTILFRTTGNSSVLDEDQKVAIYRIIQELLSNCIKHSQAWNIFVSIAWSQQEVKVTLKDNGDGMPKYIRSIDKFGITGIFIRAGLIKASAKFNKPPVGMEFELKLPLTPVQEKSTVGFEEAFANN